MAVMQTILFNSRFSDPDRVTIKKYRRNVEKLVVSNWSILISGIHWLQPPRFGSAFVQFCAVIG